MRHLLLILLSVFFAVTFDDALAQTIAAEGMASFVNAKSSGEFIENKGQIVDQDGDVRADLLFSSNAGEMNIGFLKGGVSYQLCDVQATKNAMISNTDYSEAQSSVVTTNRVDIRWPGANPNCVVRGKGQSVTSYNYYNKHFPEGLTNVHGYAEVYYDNIYSNIDLKYYFVNESIKYDYIIQPGGNAADIVLEFSGANQIQLRDDGSLEIKTSLGTIQEDKPVAFQDGNEIEVKWVLQENRLTFVLGDYDKQKPVIIDPLVRLWGTFHGGSGSEDASDYAIDADGNIILVGYTTSTSGNYMFTSGAQQSTYGGGMYDGFIVKYTASGEKLWATYYGGSGWDGIQSCAIDASGNLYISGFTSSDDAGVIATPGSHQSVLGNDPSPYVDDAFLAKFNSDGQRLWGTYYGGDGSERGESCRLDAAGNIYLAGDTFSTGTNVIATSGAPDQSFNGVTDLFIAKFNSDGNRLWGTYFGANGQDEFVKMAMDLNGNLFIIGQTTSGTGSGLATSGAFQTMGGGSLTVFLAKLNSAGSKLWCTYFSGGFLVDEYCNSLCVDPAGNVIITGSVNGNSTVIPTPGAHQETFGGAEDAYLVKFSTTGQRLWGTYYGGTGTEVAQGCTADSQGNIYICGYSNSYEDNVISTPGAYQEDVHYQFNSPSQDAFMVKFTPEGSRLWGTYYGGNAGDSGDLVSVNEDGEVILFGISSSIFPQYVIASPGAEQTVPDQSAGAGECFIAKFCMGPDAPPINFSAEELNICYGESLEIIATGIGSLSWYDQPVGGNLLATGDTYITQALVDNLTIYVQDSTSCAVSERTVVNIIVHPELIANAGDVQHINCYGESTGSAIALAEGGLLPYQWSWIDLAIADSIATQLTAGVYNAVVTDAIGCTDMVSFEIVQPEEILSSIVQQQSTTCFDGNDASVEVSAAGGIGVLDIFWTETTNNAWLQSNLAAGEYHYTIMDENACAIEFSVVISEPDQIVINQNIQLCFGEVLNVGSNQYAEAGNYQDTLTSSLGCDSLVVTTLNIYPELITNQEITLCEGESLTVGNSVYVVGDTYSDILIASTGCDSLVNTQLNFIIPSGCADPLACDYDPLSTCGGTSCDYSCYGCTDASAYNYDIASTIDNGSCLYCTADFNQDGTIDILDINIFLDSFGCLNNCPTDLNGDNIITATDLVIMIGQFGVVCGE